MRKIDLELMPSRWPFVVWGVAAIVMLSTLGVVVKISMDSHDRVTQQRGHLAELRHQLERARATEKFEPDMREAATQKVVATLQRDWNPYFEVIEGLEVPDGKLRLFQVDGASGSVRLEYELSSAQGAVEVTRQLNAGQDNPLWRFEGMQTEKAHSTVGPTEPSVTGRWLARLP